MKKTIFLSLFFALGVNAFAQSDKYIKAMEAKIQELDTTRKPDDLKDLGATFERIADAEKTQWLPYYYASLCYTNAGYILVGGQMGGKADLVDPIADKAETLLTKAEALSQNNSEIFIVKKMIATLRMTADPMSRYMQYGPKAQQALEMAKKLNPENPRIYLLEGQDKFFTPEQFGGSKAEAKKLFAFAIEKFDAVKLQNNIEPHWGKQTTQYFISQANK